MSYQTYKNGKIIEWPDTSDIKMINSTITQLQAALSTLQNKVSAEADQQDNYYGRNIKTITTSPGSMVMSPFLDSTNIKVLSEVSSATTKIYLENLEGVFINCYYFISNSATSNEILINDIETDFNNYGVSTTGPYSIRIAAKQNNTYSAGQGRLLRTNVPIHNNKQYNELDELVNNVDTFFMEDNKVTFSIPRNYGLYNTPKATESISSIDDYSIACYQDMPVLTTNRFIDLSRCLDPFDSTIVKFSGTVTINRFEFNHYIKTYQCTYKEQTYNQLKSHSLLSIERNTLNTHNLDPYLVLRQNISRYDLYISAIAYYFPQYRTIKPPTKKDPDYTWTEVDGNNRKWKSTCGSLVDLEMVPTNNLKIFSHAELPDVIYQRKVKKGTNEPATADTPTNEIEIVTIPYSSYKNIIVTISKSYETTNKIACNSTGTIYVTQDLYSNVTFCYNYNINDPVTRTVNKVYEVSDNHKTINTTYYLIFETLQEAVGQKAYRMYCNINFSQENFVANGDYKTYDPTVSLSKSIISSSVDVIPTSDMLYGDQSYGTIYTRPITLSSEAIDKFSLYCQLYRNSADSIFAETIENGISVSNYFLTTYVTFDKRIKSRKNITLYVKTPKIYCDSRHYHGQRMRATTAETTTYDNQADPSNGNKACFYYDAEQLRPFMFRKNIDHPELLVMKPGDHEYECYLRKVEVVFQNETNNTTTTYATGVITPKKMTITCKSGVEATINMTATLPEYVTRTKVSDKKAIYTISDSDTEHSFIQTYEQADGFNNHRYYYNLVYLATNIKVNSTSASWASLSCGHITTAFTSYNRGVITPSVRYTIPLYIFGRLSDIGSVNVMINSVSTSIMPLTNVDNTNIILSLEQNGQPYEYTSLQYNPEAECTAVFGKNSSNTEVTFTITEKDTRNNVVNHIEGTLVQDTGNKIKSASSNITITTTTNEGTSVIQQNPTGTFTITGSKINIELNEYNDMKFSFDISTTNAVYEVQHITDTTTSFKQFDITLSNLKTTTTYWFKYRDKIPRVAGYDSNGLEVPNWYFYNGYDFGHDNIAKKDTRLCGIVFAKSIAQNAGVNVICSYNFYEDVIQQEQWEKMHTTKDLMYLDQYFAKTTSSYVNKEENCQSAKCKIELSSKNNIQYIMYSCSDLSVHNLYINNDNLENVNAIKPTGPSEAGFCQLANSTQRIAGKNYIENPDAAKEISFLAKAAKVYALPKMLNIITNKWEILSRSNRQSKGSLTETELNKSYYIAIEDFIEPVIQTVSNKGVIVSEINHVTTSSKVTYVYSWSSYYSATSQPLTLNPFELEELQNADATIKSSGGYCWNSSKMLLSVLPPKNRNLDAMYYRHLIPYSKAQDFLTAMQNPKYYCFVPTETATESVWQATKIVSAATDETEAVTELLLDFAPILSVNYKNATAQIPTYLQTPYAATGDFKTIGVCFTWQEIPNISGINMAWTTKTMTVTNNATNDGEEEEEEE